jgi:serine/threonine-protein kinase RsbW
MCTDDRRDCMLARIHLPVANTSPRCARDMVAVIAAQWGLEEISYRAKVATSEIVTNAIIYGSDETSADVSIVVMRSENMFCVEVHDTSQASPVLGNPQLSEESGRGMIVVEDLTDSCGVEMKPSGKAVWFQIKADWPAAQ